MSYYTHTTYYYYYYYYRYHLSAEDRLINFWSTIYLGIHSFQV
jgi:hypothetical protein